MTGLAADAEIRAFFDEPTNTVTYLVWDSDSRHGVAIDPVLDFDSASGMVNDDSVAELLAAAEAEGAGAQKAANEPVLNTAEDTRGGGEADKKSQ